MIPNINLLPKYERQSVLLYRVFIGSLIVLLLLSIYFTYSYIQTKSQITKENIKQTELKTKKTALEKQLAIVTVDDKAKFETMIDFVDNYNTPNSKMIDELDLLLPENAYISNYSYDDNKVVLGSQFETKTDVSKYTKELFLSNKIDDIKVDQVKSFLLEEDILDTSENIYSIMPRYDATYSFDVNVWELKQEEEFLDE